MAIEQMNECSNIVDEETGGLCGGKDISIDIPNRVVDIYNTGAVAVKTHCNLCGHNTIIEVPIKAPVEAAIVDGYNSAHPVGA